MNRIHPRFLFFFIHSLFDLLNTRVRGAAVPHLERDLMLDLDVVLPSLPEQERIVRLLDEADQLRLLRAEADRLATTLIPALFYEMFGAPSTHPFNWPIESVGSLFDGKRHGAKCGPFGSALKKQEYIDSGVPVWGIPNVLPNHFVEAGSLFISPSKFAELQAYTVESGDLLFSRAGTVGRICVARPQAKDSIIGTNLIRLALDRKRVAPEFFSTLMTHFGHEVGGLRADTDKSAYSFMNTTVLETLQIYLPPIKLQEDFSVRFAEIRAMGVVQSDSQKRLDDLFQSSLYRAFQGEL